jgi:hypothetical protein
MRNFGGIMLLLGVLGFFYCAGKLDEYDPVPEGTSISKSLELPAGRWDIGRYLCGMVAGFGVLMAIFPKGR